MAKREKAWVQSLEPRFDAHVRQSNKGEWQVHAKAGKELTYAYQILNYNMGNPDEHHDAKYETDLLIYDSRGDGRWMPRIIVEFKIGISTHEDLTYSAKAIAHKHIHPYLRYGILVAEEIALPGRLMQHGTNFDFMAVWQNLEPTQEEWDSLANVLVEEIRISRDLQDILSDSRSKGRKKYKLLHRCLRLT